MSESLPRGGITGNYNQISILYETGEKDFYIPQLENYQPGRFESPTNASAIADDILKRGLWILAGNTSSDKLSLARHFAWLVKEKLNTNPNISILEWKHSGSRSVDRALETYSERTIFILPNLLPQHFNYDFRKLAILSNRQHIIICTTENDKIWAEVFQDAVDSKLLKQYWWDLEKVNLYEQKQLTRILVVQIFKKKNDIHPAIIQRFFESKYSYLFKNIRTNVVARKLETPDNIEYFVSMMCNEASNPKFDENVINDCIYGVKDDTRRIYQMYNSLETTRERLLVLALNFFDGMADDQFFAALETLINNSWQERDPSLMSLDYHDFEKLRNFFDYSSPTESVRIIKTTMREQRQKLLKVAWKSYRRHILSARSVLYDLVQGSVQRQTDNWELYGSSERRDLLRKSISETISDIGLESVLAIEDILLKLAINQNPGVQAVAARAVARWREYNSSEKTFKTLRRWMYNNDLETSIKSLVSEEDRDRLEDPKTYLKGTIALAIGYAAQSDPPNKINLELLTLFEKLAADNSQLVLTNLCTYTLPMVAQIHLHQIQHIVLVLTTHDKLHRAIANSLSQVYSKHPEEIKYIIDKWYYFCEEEIKNKKHTQSNQVLKLLACVAEIYGRLPYGRDKSVITINNAFSTLKNVLILTNNKLVRERTLSSIIGLSRDYFAKLQNIVSRLTSDELEQIVDKIIEIYLDQRANLPNGEQRWYHKSSGRYYPIWVSGRQRPMTEIEQEMLAWLQDNRDAVSQQISVRSLAAFARIIERAFGNSEPS